MEGSASAEWDGGHGDNSGERVQHPTVSFTDHALRAVNPESVTWSTIYGFQPARPRVSLRSADRGFPGYKALSNQG
ncbi:hypothetical protein CMUS01_00260 [Colletotrichum musicola]|uniref:Uncharacterized protein n=1 Tax=Colletotrichum musicola TaxID=2175873 RepID=A0A8H6NZL6_9PEZI|nr:hypothetical protein CMUS01_00260 [Colletotrichum musicola]